MGTIDTIDYLDRPLWWDDDDGTTVTSNVPWAKPRRRAYKPVTQYRFDTGDLELTYSKGKAKCSRRFHRMCCYHTRVDDTLVAYIAAPIWLLVWFLTFSKWGKLLYKYT